MWVLPPRFATVAPLLIALLPSFEAAAQTNGGVIPLDGLSALVAAEGADEPLAEPTLKSDVAFFAELLLRVRFGDNAAEMTHNEHLMTEARRVAVLVATVGKIARQIGEKLTPKQLERTRMILLQLAGGEAGVQTIIHKYGVSNRRYQGWIAHLTLTQNLVRYEIALITPQLDSTPRPKKEATDSAVEGARRQLTARLRRERLSHHLEAWLGELVKNTSIRLVE